MARLKVIRDPRVEAVFKSYPSAPRKKLGILRQIILDVAHETKEIEYIEETLKWGEPSYVTKQGSTIRVDWKEKSPNHYSLYFKCTSQLIPTFKKVFGDSLTFESNRAIVFGLNERIPKLKLKKCIKCALQYHTLKHLPDLGLKT